MAFSASPICSAATQGTIALIPASGSVDSSGSDLAVVGLIWYTGLGTTLSSLADNYGNTYRARTARNGDNARTVIYDAKNITPGNAHVVDPTWSDGNNFGYGVFATWTGSDLTEPFDKETVPLASTTPTNANSLCITIEGTQQGGTFLSATIDSGTIIAQAARTGNLGGAWAHFLQSGGPSAYNPTYTNTGTATMNSVMAVYLPATGGGGGSSIVPIIDSYFRRRLAA